MSTALLTEIIAGIPILASAIVSVIVALKANAKASQAHDTAAATSADLTEHESRPHP